MSVIQTKYNDDKRFSKDAVSLSKDFPIKYATFNAYQMSDLIHRKLIEDPSIRDQVYPGSNISILIDLVSTMYQTLSYQLNHAASESMFSQSQYYENIVRIAKLLGYNAGGITPSTTMVRIEDAISYYSDENGTLNLDQEIVIPPFAMISTSDGKYYSYSPYKWSGCAIPRNLDSGQPYDILMHNGIWKRYQNILTPTGIDFETFVLPMIRSEMDEQKYATTSHIFAVEVIKQYSDESHNVVDWSQTEINIYHPTNYGLFKGLDNKNDTDQIHNFLYNGLGGDDCNVFNVELNEIKQLVLKFGDGITTKKLTPNSELYVFYLETQGMDGAVQSSSEEITMEHSPTMFSIPTELYNKLFGDYTPVSCHILTNSTQATKEEGVDDIRERAPHWFKMNNRLVTKEDYEFFMMNEPSINGVFNSVNVMNNWEYVSTFYRWLNQLGVTKHDNPRYYLNPARFTKYGGASLSDAVDSNNVYIWYITNFGDVDDINYEQMVQRCKSMMVDIKDICHEPVFLPAIPITCEISSMPYESGIKYLKANKSTTVAKILKQNASATDGDNGYQDSSYLEVRINDDYSISSQEIVERIASLFQYYFNVTNRLVGFGSFNTNDLLNLILEKIPAISDVYTVYLESSTAKPIYTHGISMACFSTNTSLINLGDDLQIKNGTINLEKFMYPVLYTNTEKELGKRIKVINKNMNLLSKNNY